MLIDSYPLFVFYEHWAWICFNTSLQEIYHYFRSCSLLMVVEQLYILWCYVILFDIIVLFIHWENLLNLFLQAFRTFSISSSKSSQSPFFLSEDYKPSACLLLMDLESSKILLSPSCLYEVEWRHIGERRWIFLL